MNNLVAGCFLWQETCMLFSQPKDGSQGFGAFSTVKSQLSGIDNTIENNGRITRNFPSEKSTCNFLRKMILNSINAISLILLNHFQTMGIDWGMLIPCGKFLSDIIRFNEYKCPPGKGIIHYHDHKLKRVNYEQNTVSTSE